MTPADASQLRKLCGRLLHTTAPRHELITNYGETILELATEKQFVTCDFFKSYDLTDAGRMFFNAAPTAAPAPPVSPRAIEQHQALEALGLGSLLPAAAQAVPTPTPEPEHIPEEQTMMPTETKPVLERGTVRAAIDSALTAVPKTLLELALEIGAKPGIIALHIKSLTELGLITRSGEGLPGRPYKYSRSGSVPQAQEPERSSLEEARARVSKARATQIVKKPAPSLSSVDPEITAMQNMVAALEPLNRIAQVRIMSWLASRLELA